MKILDLTYINSSGGRELFNLIKSKIQFDFYFLDPRLNENSLSHFAISKDEKSRKYNLLKLKKIDTYVTLNNVPPPIHLKSRVIVYFHNILLLNTSYCKLSLKEKFLLKIKFWYIKYKAKKNYSWVVQTNLMKRTLSKAIGIDSKKISVFPFFEEVKIDSTLKKTPNSFIYVASNLKHKNLDKLIDAFIEVALSTVTKIELHLTIYQNEIINKVIPKNLTINFHGTISKTQINNLYKNIEYSIYPSLNESFGLPLIESVHHQCKVLASDLPYVHEIIRPSLTFNPFDVNSIKDCILQSLNSEIPTSKVLIKNKLDNFIEYIKKDV